ncbi:hypothetical protein Sviol_49270 [Streptomyces violascens]|uniref:Uncharacterized protein n=1 Tax=Streptomyces violascens TaxID=67381 RepID=A0ABQ3QTH4_9ACTN|nr:hypothetical protein Sviol_49270 [Streptomyces violascens]
MVRGVCGHRDSIASAATNREWFCATATVFLAACAAIVRLSIAIAKAATLTSGYAALANMRAGWAREDCVTCGLRCACLGLRLEARPPLIE